MRAKSLPDEATVSEGNGENPATLKNCKPATMAFRMRTILVPIDFSDCSVGAINYAMGLAELCQGRLILLHIVEPGLYPENFAAVQALEETNRSQMETGNERLEELNRKIIGQRVPAETLVRLGRAPSEIPDTARALGADLIVIATHGHTGVKHVLLGSTAERVVRQAPCPVLTVPCRR